VVSSQARLREALEAATGDGLGMKALTVLAPQRDRFRLDTPAGHRDAEWLANHVARFAPERTRHLRGFDYALIGEAKPNGEGWRHSRMTGSAFRWSIRRSNGT
jgi:hypothetical protein